MNEDVVDEYFRDPLCTELVVLWLDLCVVVDMPADDVNIDLNSIRRDWRRESSKVKFVEATFPPTIFADRRMVALPSKLPWGCTAEAV